MRTSQHLLTRLINNLITKVEISSQMASSSLLGLSSIAQSHETWFCFPWPLLRTHCFNDVDPLYWPGPFNNDDGHDSCSDLNESSNDIRIEDFLGSDEHGFAEITVDSNSKVQLSPLLLGPLILAFLIQHRRCVTKEKKVKTNSKTELQ